MSEDTLKIMIVGLENVGKTSILLTLEKKYSLLGALTPTKGIERSTFKILGYPVSAWDLGGQEAYRKGYLQKDIFFEETDLFIYCMDVKDPGNHELAIDYYQKILEIFKKLKQKVPIIIFLHKIDPDIKNDPEIRKNVKILKDMVQSSTSADFEIEFYETSIYDDWRLTKAFSAGLQKLSTKTEVLSSHLAEFAKQIKANAIILLNQNGYLIGEYASNEMSAFLCQSISTQSLYMYLVMKERDIKPEKITVDIKEGFILFRGVTINEEEFFIIFYSKVTRSLELFGEVFPKFAEQTKDIFKFFFK
ncbi:MAG: GTP-binding protein [Candidatus Helarchaeota archaeon]|nr:GTP-binding protein [Candidatus Helarchaeota archaeon]